MMQCTKKQFLFISTVCLSLVAFASAFSIPRRTSHNIGSCHLQSARTTLPSPLLGADSSRGFDFSDTVRDMLWGMTTYFSSMVDPSTLRFFSLSRPQSGELLHVHCPIRDLGVAWDATTVLLFWSEQQEWLQRDKSRYQQYSDIHRQRLQDAIYRTIQVYNASYTSASCGSLVLDYDILREPPNLAHSALSLLSSTGALRLSLFDQDMTEVPPLNALASAVLSMQCQDGAFRVEFGSEEVYRGIEFYPGEAMVALMEVYQLSASMSSILDISTRQAIVPAVVRAFHFYADFYHKGNVDTNYNIWQVQAFARLFHVLHDNESEHHNRNQATLVADFVIELCEGLVKSRAWKELARGRSFYPNLQTVEIACGLDAIVEGINVALPMSLDVEAALFWTNAENAVHFLKSVQDQIQPDAVGCGGLGFGGLQALEQVSARTTIIGRKRVLCAIHHSSNSPSLPSVPQHFRSSRD